jgi:hypothetical protein
MKNAKAINFELLHGVEADHHGSLSVEGLHQTMLPSLHPYPLTLHAIPIPVSMDVQVLVSIHVHILVRMHVEVLLSMHVHVLVYMHISDIHSTHKHVLFRLDIYILKAPRLIERFRRISTSYISMLCNGVPSYGPTR